MNMTTKALLTVMGTVGSLYMQFLSAARILLQLLLLLVPHTVSYIGNFSYRIGRILSCTEQNLPLVIYV